jgi:hypothetical protein
MSASVIGIESWSSQSTNLGALRYDIAFRVETSDPLDGPTIVMNAPGLPAIGSYWDYGNDVNQWAFCSPERRVKPLYIGERCKVWRAECIFETYNPGGGGFTEQRCNSTTIDNPLLEPIKVSGSFLKYTRRATRDRNNKVIKNYDHSPFKGSEVDFDTGHWTVRIGMNLSALPSPFAPSINQLNDATLWGAAPRCVKFSGAAFTRLYYGVCTAYYFAEYDFEVNSETFDRWIQPWCYRKLKDGGNVNNPKDFEAITDEKGNPTGNILKSDGTIWDGTGSEPQIKIEKYSQTNLLLLGIPSVL